MADRLSITSTCICLAGDISHGRRDEGNGEQGVAAETASKKHEGRPHCGRPSCNTPTQLHRLRERFLFLLQTVTTEQVWQALRERRARHYSIAAGLERLHLQVALKMVQEADDRRRLFELGFEFRYERHRLGVQVVKIEDYEGRTFVFRSIGQTCDSLLLRLHELHFHAEFACSLLDLGLEKQVVDEAEDARGRVLLHWN